MIRFLRPVFSPEVRSGSGDSRFSILAPARAGSVREAVAKHRQAALRFGFCRFVLQHVPVLREMTILDPDNIGGDPGNWAAIS
jgi:hypothetical protein